MADKPIKDRIIIQPLSIDTNCTIAEPPCLNFMDQTKQVGNSWTEYGAVVLQPEEGQTCLTPRIIFTVKIKLSDGNWYNASSTSAIKIISGANPQTRNGQAEAVCNWENTPRATWIFQVNTGTNCTIQEMGISGTDINGNSLATTFDITIDDGTCTQPEIQNKETYIVGQTFNDQYEINQKIYFDNSLMYWFLSVIMILGILNLKKRNGK